jgi:hypothetical protein
MAVEIGHVSGQLRGDINLDSAVEQLKPQQR